VTSLNALDAAVEIAKKNNAKIIILNISERNIKFLHNGREMEYYNSVSEDVLLALGGVLEQKMETVPKIIHSKGQVVECIISKSLSEQCDLIVMGTHGASGYREGYLGSNTYNVIKYSICPVLIIPRHKKYNSFKRVLFPIRPSSGALVRYDVMRNFISAGSILQVLGLPYRKTQTETAILEKIIDEVRYQIHEDQVIVNTSWAKADTVGNDILNFAEANASELLVITTALDAVTKPDFIGPHTQKLINLSKIPVLNIKQCFILHAENDINQNIKLKGEY
jgi:nucleotide-binding universal stress UspA family protein